MTEKQKIAAFVREQRNYVSNERQWKRRLAVYGFAIRDTKAGRMIAILPRNRVVCALPTNTHA